MVTGTDIYTLWKGYRLRGVGCLASMDIRYVEEAIKTESGMTTCFSCTVAPCSVTLLFPFLFSTSCLQVLEPVVGNSLSKILKCDTSSIKIACAVDFLLKDIQ